MAIKFVEKWVRFRFTHRQLLQILEISFKSYLICRTISFISKIMFVCFSEVWPYNVLQRVF